MLQLVIRIFIKNSKALFGKDSLQNLALEGIGIKGKYDCTAFDQKLLPA
jgi:lipase chaperone LimK